MKDVDENDIQLSNAPPRDDEADHSSEFDGDGETLLPPSGRPWAAIVFGAMLAGAIPIIIVLGRRRWFSQDEWYFLQYRTLTPKGIFSPYFGHLMALPIITWQVMFRIFGLHSYLPYQMLTVLLHLVVCILIRTVMRRSGVSPWLSTLTAGTFILFGSGYQNITMAMEINYLGSISLGLAFLLLTDHDGQRLTRQDLLGLACGIGALMCSNIGIGMVAGVVAAALIRRRWKPAAIMCAPVMLFAVWYLAIGRTSSGVGISAQQATLSGSAWHWVHQIVAWNAVGLSAVPRGLVRNSWGLEIPLALLVGALFLAGLATSVHRWNSKPIGLTVAAIAFITSGSIGRGEFPASLAAIPRYVYVVAVLLLPILAVAIQQVFNFRRYLIAPILAIFLIGVPGNIAAFTPDPPEATFTLIRQEALAIANSPFAANADPSLAPLPSPFLPGPSVGWLLEAKRQGRIPAAGQIPNDVENRVAVLLQVRQLDRSSHANHDCETGMRIRRGVVLKPTNGEVVEVSVVGGSSTATVVASLLRKDNVRLRYGSRTFSLSDGHQFQFAGDDLRVRFTSTDGMVRVCH